jgi:uncharacterized protein YlxW (UPF0749 family)
MNSMLNHLKTLVIVAVLGGAGFYVYANYLNSCNQTIVYGIGTVDARFGITEQEFADLAQGVEGVWENPFTKEFFMYDPNAEFKINLVFDERQQRTVDERNTRTEIQTQEQEYRAQVSTYESELAQYNQENASYDAAVAIYEARLQKYNEQVDYWNKNGGAPQKEYAALQQEKSALQRESRSLESRRLQLNQKAITLNTQASGINAIAKDLNLDVNAYNGTYGTTREFDQGSYTGSAINIYQFSAKEDLRLVLAHEFGHALGLNHIEDPNAVMYYLMDKQNIKSLHLSDWDIAALKTSCHIR